MGKFTDLMQAALYGTPTDLMKKPSKETFMDFATELDGDLADGVIVGPGIALSTGGNGARVYINAAGAYMVDSANVFPAVHYIDYNGAIVLDLSAIQTYETYVFAINDYAVASVIIDSGFGNTIIGSATRDGFTPVQAIQLRGGESIAITRITGSAFVIVAGFGNPDIVRIPGPPEIRMWEQPDGRYSAFFERSVSASTDTNFDIAVSGKAIDFTNAVFVSARIREDNTTSRSPVKLRSLGNDGAGGGRAVINNPNAAALTVGIYLTDVEVTV